MQHNIIMLFFFFKQKTAYEIGLGIPAEPLFRSGHKAASSRTSEAALWPSTYISPLSNSTPCIQIGRASCRERVEISVGGVSLKKKKRKVGKNVICVLGVYCVGSDGVWRDRRCGY